MPDAKIDGKSAQSVPPSVKAAMSRGYPKGMAQAVAGSKRPTSTVKVK